MFACVTFIFLTLSEIACVHFYESNIDHRVSAAGVMADSVQLTRSRRIRRSLLLESTDATVSRLARRSIALCDDPTADEEEEAVTHTHMTGAPINRIRFIVGVAVAAFQSSTGARIDQAAAILLPCLFGLFNVWYCVHYMD